MNREAILWEASSHELAKTPVALNLKPCFLCMTCWSDPDITATLNKVLQVYAIAIQRNSASRASSFSFSTFSEPAAAH